tara:strand:- start:4737 stop:4868 length:132 start_codon:yes stop_codon:yes gene_type:complete
MSNGKGSRRREMKISQEKYYDNWNKIFNKKDKNKKTKKNNRED